MGLNSEIALFTEVIEFKPLQTGAIGTHMHHIHIN